MLGLGAYESSSEDETDNKLSPALKGKETADPVKTFQPEIKTQKAPDRAPPALEEALDPEPSGPFLGPVQHEEIRPLHAFDGQLSTSRTLIHDLTLPPVPNLDIPPSPPGSPNPSLNAKFAHFLSLKKQDVHFNEKLAGSTSLKNPSLLKKLMEHAGITEETQYATSLPPDVWDPSSFPSWGYKEELLKAQKDINLKAEAMRSTGQRDTIEFVSVHSGRSGPASTSQARLK